MPELTGSNRDKLLTIIQNEDLSKIVDQLYRPGATVGDHTSVLREFNGDGSLNALYDANGAKITHILLP